MRTNLTLIVPYLVILVLVICAIIPTWRLLRQVRVPRRIRRGSLVHWRPTPERETSVSTISRVVERSSRLIEARYDEREERARLIREHSLTSCAAQKLKVVETW